MTAAGGDFSDEDCSVRVAIWVSDAYLAAKRAKTQDSDRYSIGLALMI